MKKIWLTVFLPLIGIALGFVFFLVYIHVISWISIPIGIAILIGAIFLFGGWFVMLLINIKDFIVSIFKENKEVDERGFKKHF